VGGIVLTSRRLLLVAAVLTLGACAGGGDDDTLQPLPIAGGTVATAPAVTVAAAVAGTATTPGGLPLPTVVAAAASTTTTVASAPTGDWDGADFDVGTIVSVSTLGAYSTIELDRLSYTGSDGRTVDAAGLRAEPVVAWWRTSPFSNVRVQTRTFVLAPDVEVLTLDPSGRAAACADPPPAVAPEPAWLESGTSALATLTAADVAVLTYADGGLVARIRLTRGC
jgi:hypothetical protein